jgi:hypothetical protein
VRRPWLKSPRRRRRSSATAIVGAISTPLTFSASLTPHKPPLRASRRQLCNCAEKHPSYSDGDKNSGSRNLVEGPRVQSRSKTWTFVIFASNGDRLKLVIARWHGTNMVSEACDLRWDDIDLPKRTIIMRRLKGSTDSVHYLERD